MGAAKPEGEFRGVIPLPEECVCTCHVFEAHGSVRHEMPCCHPCKICGKFIVTGHEEFHYIERHLSKDASPAATAPSHNDEKANDRLTGIAELLESGIDRIITSGNEAAVITQQIPGRHPGGTAAWVRGKSSRGGIPTRQLCSESFTERYTLSKFIPGGTGVIRIDIGCGATFKELAHNIIGAIDAQPSFWDNDIVVMEKTS